MGSISRNKWRIHRGIPRVISSNIVPGIAEGACYNQTMMYDVLYKDLENLYNSGNLNINTIQEAFHKYNDLVNNPISRANYLYHKVMAQETLNKVIDTNTLPPEIKDSINKIVNEFTKEFSYVESLPVDETFTRPTLYHPSTINSENPSTSPQPSTTNSEKSPTSKTNKSDVSSQNEAYSPETIDFCNDMQTAATIITAISIFVDLKKIIAGLNIKIIHDKIDDRPVFITTERDSILHKRYKARVYDKETGLFHSGTGRSRDDAILNAKQNFSGNKELPKQIGNTYHESDQVREWSKFANKVAIINMFIGNPVITAITAGIIIAKGVDRAIGHFTRHHGYINIYINGGSHNVEVNIQRCHFGRRAKVTYVDTVTGARAEATAHHTRDAKAKALRLLEQENNRIKTYQPPEIKEVSVNGFMEMLRFNYLLETADKIKNSRLSQSKKSKLLSILENNYNNHRGIFSDNKVREYAETLMFISDGKCKELTNPKNLQQMIRNSELVKKFNELRDKAFKELEIARSQGNRRKFNEILRKLKEQIEMELNKAKNKMGNYSSKTLYYVLINSITNSFITNWSMILKDYNETYFINKARSQLGYIDLILKSFYKNPECIVPYVKNMVLSYGYGFGMTYISEITNKSLWYLIPIQYQHIYSGIVINAISVNIDTIIILPLKCIINGFEDGMVDLTNCIVSYGINQSYSYGLNYILKALHLKAYTTIISIALPTLGIISWRIYKFYSEKEEREKMEIEKIKDQEEKIKRVKKYDKTIKDYNLYSIDIQILTLKNEENKIYNSNKVEDGKKKFIKIKEKFEKDLKKKQNDFIKKAEKFNKNKDKEGDLQDKIKEREQLEKEKSELEKENGKIEKELMKEKEIIEKEIINNLKPMYEIPSRDDQNNMIISKMYLEIRKSDGEQDEIDLYWDYKNFTKLIMHIKDIWDSYDVLLDWNEEVGYSIYQFITKIEDDCLTYNIRNNNYEAGMVTQGVSCYQDNGIYNYNREEGRTGFLYNKKVKK